MAYQHQLFAPFHGDRLRLARLLSSLSLDELGGRVSASRQYVHQMETGAKFPSEQMVGSLAAALRVRTEFFREPITNQVREEDCHFRKLASASRATMAQAAARGTLVEALVIEIERSLRLPPVDFPDLGRPDGARTTEDIAEAARRHWDLGLDGPITHMTRVVENAGAVVVPFVDLCDRIDAMSIARRRPIIVRSAAKPAAVRLRFDLAHECGHLLMHMGVTTGTHETEDEANRFASAFLIPRTAFAREFPRARTLNWRAMLDMKRRWGVSLRAIVRRALELGLIGADEYRRAQVHLSKSGQARVELLDDTLTAERAELLDLALQAMGPRLGDLAEALGVEPEMIEAITGAALRDVPKPGARPRLALVRSDRLE